VEDDRLLEFLVVDVVMHESQRGKFAVRELR
jgi:hypothetical protein